MRAIISWLSAFLLVGCSAVNHATMGAEGESAQYVSPLSVSDVAKEQAQIALAREEAKRLLSNTSEVGAYGVEAAKGFPETPRELGRVGDRKRMFVTSVTMICGPVDMAANYSRFAEALVLFDQPESEKIGNWLHVAEGGAIALGSVLTLVGTQGENPSKELQGVGAVLMGGGGVFAILKATGLFDYKVAEEALTRVEMNRQFGILIRQYIPAISAASETCRPLREYVKNIPPEPVDDDIPTERYQTLREAAEQLAVIHDGLVKIGSSAGVVYKEMEGKGWQSAKVAKDLKGIADMTHATRDGWAQDRTVISRQLECIRQCLAPAE
ncbi:hypothetical protein F0U61_36745 [Archangium violaceum]|uniref:hypothetical protein n=1 Tax=Archangium violaceum TaxID=83451 RepID=UPI002B2F8F23|nr:hypothetical protein F0U61_36745 [Archangium violaceum]